MRDLRCPMCTHDEFRGIVTRNDERKAMCLGCDGMFTLDELNEPHGLDAMCVMTPHVMSDIPEEVTIGDAMTGDLPDESQQQGFHRTIAFIRCVCGEEFHSQHDFEDHME